MNDECGYMDIIHIDARLRIIVLIDAGPENVYSGVLKGPKPLDQAVSIVDSLKSKKQMPCCQGAEFPPATRTS